MTQTLSRRRLISAGACALCAAGSPTCGARAAAECADVTVPPPVALTAAEQERHRIFLLLSMALVHDGWGLDRQRPDLMRAYAEAEPGRRFADYAGHNIGAVLVDANGEIVCFALNRNVALNSTLEHAEARAVRAAVRIANSRRRAKTSLSGFGSVLRGDRIYTTLEPCAQCAGIMDLASLASVTYAQDDPTQHRISSVIYNLNADGRSPPAPLPIRATFLPAWDQLDAAYRAFVAEMPPGGRIGLTSFLETVAAYRIFRAAVETFDGYHAAERTNANALDRARAFRRRWRDQLAGGAVPP